MSPPQAQSPACEVSAPIAEACCVDNPFALPTRRPCRTKRGMASSEILCIGSALWDIVGRSASHMKLGADVPGRIVRTPGGVALNIALTLTRFGLRPVLLTALGNDDNGLDLLAATEAHGMETGYIYISEDLPTDTYVAIEGANGLIAAIADAHSLEAAGEKILLPLRDGRLGSERNPYEGLIALDGNLTEALLAEISGDPAFALADLRLAPASSGKAERLQPLLGHPRATFYVNREEAGLIARRTFLTAGDAARGLVDRGAARVIVTDGADSAAEGSSESIREAKPPAVLVTRVTGAGDTFMAAHIAAEARGEDPEEAFATAQTAAADFVSGETAL
jgi:pseudouridine kinase